MRKSKDGSDATFGGSAPSPRLTPSDVQQKEFGVTRVGGGYRMRDVDEFLDQVTVSMTALVEENRHLRDQAGSGAMIGAPDLDEVARQADEIIHRAREEAAQIIREARADRPVPLGGDRAAISAFLLREREFLQSVAGLVQGHAEAVKGMARDARDAANAAAEATGPAGAGRASPARASVAEPAAKETERPPVAPPAGTAGGTTPAASDPEPPASTDPDQHTQAMEEPVRIEEPEPATVGRAESEDPAGEEGDRSLRDLFWGEE